jgi:two-component system CheB/CheR fusion protein
MDESDTPAAQAPHQQASDAAHIVVGLGASAGGIKALKDFFAAVPADSGMAYVVILHLSPEHESHLAQILQSTARIPVMQVQTRVHIDPNKVYVVSPNNRLSILDGHIEIAPLNGIEERRAPVDMFFRTLADAQHARAVSVVLSGTGANGSMGMKRVKECGGLCIAQEPGEADFPDMPRNAIATGLVDYVLPVAEMARRLIAFRDRLAAPIVMPKDDADEQEQSLIDIFSLIRVRTGHDFTSYKRSTVLRRIERRMNVLELGSMAEYARLLRENRDEVRVLLRDLLISVTNFFRDRAAFAALERILLPLLFQGKGPSDHVRVWVAGCATGEEAYSIAMLLSEHVPDPVNGPTIQVFATDIDTAALAKARAGLYTLHDAADISPERLRRFFFKEGDSYRTRRELRELVLFAPHNVIKDPPFSHLDLITCRNLLIYLNRPAQERVLRLFHFGLNPGGYLFLGNSETADEGSLFVAVSKEHHIFQSRSVESNLTLPALPATGATPLRPLTDERVPDVRMRERMSYQELHQRLLECYAPPSVVVNQDYEILHLSERAGRYLQFTGGEPSQNLMKVVRPELRLELHSALYHAIQHRTNAEAEAGPVTINGTTENVKIVVNPVFGELDTSRGMILVVFQAIGSQDATPQRVSDVEPASEPIARQLEEELMRLKVQLRTNIEQHELQQEELKASNEELQAMNEELRSSSEELETSKEELQSVNEELTTVNQELKTKIDELSEANNDTRNLMNSTELATIFIDRAMRIKLFTPRARTLFNLIPSDTGRSLLDITNKLHYPELVQDIERVLDTLTISEREVQATGDDWYIARVLPYRTADDRIAGVVLTFTDISLRKRTEQALRESEERVRLVVESVSDFAILTLDPEGRIRSWNPGAQEVFGYGEQEALGQPFALVFAPEDREAGVPEKEMAQARQAGRASDERWHQRKDGRRIFISGVMAPLMAGDGIIGYTKIARDLTQRAEYEQQLRTAREELGARVAERTRELAAANEALRREMTERSQSEETRVRLLRQLVRAQEDERRRMSRELHDEMGQNITALGLKLSALKERDDCTEEVRVQIAALQRIVTELDANVEFLVWKMRPTGLDDLGLEEALADYVASWSRHFGIVAQFESRLGSRLSAEIETVLYRIAQEALNNVAKHARASAVEVRLQREADAVSLRVQDNGAGFDTAVPVGARSLGLLSMRERAALVSGAVTIESQPGLGTVVRVTVPT